jgi:hypothetical protein
LHTLLAGGGTSRAAEADGFDACSGGRVICGVGVGYGATELAALGVDLAERNELCDEAIGRHEGGVDRPAAHPHRPALELDLRATDVEVVHTNGYTPFTGTTMDVVLRSLGIRTIVATGVTLDAGIIGMGLEAVALGYRVVVPADAVVGMPADHGDAVLEHSIPWLGVVSTTTEIIATWARAARSSG